MFPALDHSEASLTVLEEILDDATDFVPEMTARRLSGLVQDVGCYILEIGMREFGGCYLWYEDRDSPVRVVGEPSFRVALSTWKKVRNRLNGDKSDNIPFHYAGFAQRVRQATPGTDVIYI